MLSELATCLYALTAMRDNGLWGPRRRQFLPKALSDVQFSKAAGPGQVPSRTEVVACTRLGSQRAGVLRVIGR